MQRPTPRGALAAFLAYGATSVLLFGVRVLADPAGSHVGFGSDPGVFVWQFAWWPHAIAEGMDPFFTDLVWAPVGYNVAHSTAVPGASILAAPLTAIAGPLVAYNLVALVAPALTAWTAFLLCRHLTSAFWPSLAGGYLFGFSTYEVGHMLGHLNLVLLFVVPLAVLLVLRRVEGSMGPVAFVLLLGLALAFQFLLSLEVFATLVLFGAMAFGLGWAGLPARRPAILQTAGLAMAAFGLAGLAMGPYLYAYFVNGQPTPIYDFYPSFFSIDLLNFVVPTAVSRLGQGPFSEIAATFTGNLSESVGYLGVPLVGVVGLFAVRNRESGPARVLLAILGLVCVAALGPVLHVAGKESVPLPWTLFLRLPLIRHALPGRFMAYAFLAISIIAALWLADRGVSLRLRVALGVLAVIFLLPTTPSLWHTEIDTPPFFTSGRFRSYIEPGENVLVIPYGNQGNSMLWQAQADLSFRMPGGYLGVVPPPQFSEWPIVDALYSGDVIPGHEEHLKSFLAAHGVELVVVDVQARGDWLAFFEPLGVRPLEVGGVRLYRVPISVLSASADVQT
jgi:hypothetical protein